MKQPIRLTLSFLYISTFSYTMDPSPAAKKPTLTKKPRSHTLLWLTDDLLIVASRNGCYIKNPFLEDSSFQLHDQLPYNIILNKNKTKVGLFCQDSFVVYNITTQKKVWSLSIPFHEDYSVTFSPTDEIILYHKGCVTIDKRQSLCLPFIEPDKTFEISCNYHTQEIMYPSNNCTFARTSLIDNRIISRHARIIDDDGKKYFVCSAFYNQQSPHIALLTREKISMQNKKPAQKMFLLNSATNKVSKIALTYEGKEEKSYYRAQFLPYSSIIAILCPHFGIHLWDFVQQKEIWIAVLTNGESARKNKSNTFDIDPSAMHCAAIIKKSYFVNQIPQHIVRASAQKHICFAYWFLRNYRHGNNLLPADIIHILIYYLYVAYNIKLH